jgi:Lrp/AsnC family transcriptional regulator for asnA, asnC and gidA
MTGKQSHGWTFDHNFYGLDPSTFPVDEMDKAIIGLLMKNSRISFTEIAKKLDVNESTIRRRIESLVQKEVIKGFTVCLSNSTLDSGVRAYVYIKVDTLALDEIVSYLCSSVHSLSVYRIVGTYDVVCEVVFNSMNELHTYYDALFKRSAVQDIMVNIVVNSYKSLPLVIG